MPEKASRTSIPPAVFLGFALVLAILGVAYLVYDFSPDGLGFLVGKAAAPFVLLFLISLPWRKSANRLSIILGITLFFFVVGSGEDVRDALDMREAEPLLAVSQDLDDFQRHAREHPGNRMLNLMARVMEISAEQEARLFEIFDSLEPPGVPAVLDVERMDGQELRTLADALGQAEQNARSAQQKLEALTADARNRIEIEAKSMPKLADDALAGFDAGVARILPLRMAVLQGREHYYRAVHVFTGFLAENHGRYRLLPGGGFQFADQALADSHDRLMAQLQTAWDILAAAENAVDRYEKESAARFSRLFGGSGQ